MIGVSGGSEMRFRSTFRPFIHRWYPQVVLPKWPAVLRDKITRDSAAFRCVVDQICIHGVDASGERFWNALGAELGPQLHLQSEIQLHLSTHTNRFAQLLDQVRTASVPPVVS